MPCYELYSIIRIFQKDYAEYLGVLPECDKLLANLEEVRDSLKEKEFELKRITKDHQKNLEKSTGDMLTVEKVIEI